KTISHSDDKAKDILYEICKHIEDPAGKYRQIFPDMEVPSDEPWNRNQIYLSRDLKSKDATIEAAGILSDPTGGRCDILILDDCVSQKNSILNPGMRPMVKQAFWNWYQLLDKTSPHRKLIYIATRWHTQDLTSELLTRPGFYSRVYAIDENFTPLWRRIDREKLVQEYKIQGSFEFNRAYRNIPISEEDRLFHEGPVQSMFDPVVDRDVAKEMLKVTGVDLAIGQSSKAAYTVIATVSFDEKGKKYLIDLRRGRFSSPDTARHMIEVNNLYKPQLILVENNTYQQALIQWIKDLGGLDMPVQSFTTTVNKLNQEVGLPSLAVEIENGLWCIPMKWHQEMEEDKCDCAFCVLKKELLEYPASGHTDCVMAMWLAREAYRKLKGEVQKGEFHVWEW
ncbi:MAG: hypothetical protein ACK4WF_03495, partial [Candidatus Brocadiales bacterium]